MNPSTKSVWLISPRLFIPALIVAGGAVVLGGYVPKWLVNSPKVKHLTHIVSRGNLLVTITENATVKSSNNREIASRAMSMP